MPTPGRGRVRVGGNVAKWIRSEPEHVVEAEGAIADEAVIAEEPAGRVAHHDIGIGPGPLALALGAALEKAPMSAAAAGDLEARAGARLARGGGQHQLGRGRGMPRRARGIDEVADGVEPVLAQAEEEAGR